MATDAPLVATVKGTQGEAIAVGLANAAGLRNTLFLEVTSRLVVIQGSGARLRCRESEKSAVENGSPE